jgi:dUTP pyrophosphatase
MQVQIINKSHHELPAYKTAEAAGMDLRAFIEEPVILAPLERKLIPTGLFIALPKGYEAQIRPRSGLALQMGITVLNSPGTIDSDYRGEIKILLVNLSNEACKIEDGERVAQMIICKHETISWAIAEELSTSERGEGGYGSTGK